MKPRTELEIFYRAQFASKTAALRRAVQSRTEKSSAPAAPAHAQSPIPSAGAAHNSGAWFLFDLGLTDEEARRVEESF